MSSYILAGLVLLLYGAIAFVLIQKYRRTHNAGFVWLGIAVIVWPLASNVIGQGEHAAIDRFIRQQPVAHGAANLGSLVFGVAVGQQLVGLVLLLVAVLYLCRPERHPAV